MMKESFLIIRTISINGTEWTPLICPYSYGHFDLLLSKDGAVLMRTDDEMAESEVELDAGGGFSGHYQKLYPAALKTKGCPIAYFKMVDGNLTGKVTGFFARSEFK